MKRKRIPYYFPHSKFDLWRDLVADPNEGDEINDEYEDFGKLTYLLIGSYYKTWVAVVCKI